MKVRLGYACISKTLDITCSRTITYSEFLKNKDFSKLNEIIISNLESLEKLIDYNIKNHIHFFRISSKLIPLSTIVEFDYITPYKMYYDRIADKILKNDLRIDFHPSEFCVLNSTKKEVIENTLKILKYHYKLLEALKIKKKVLVLHVGSSVLGKKNSLKRFIHQFYNLKEYLRDCIVIENDDKVFTIEDCLVLKKELNVPIVLDYHHFVCNPSNIDFEEIFFSWKDQIPKIHFSSPKSKLKKEFRSHHDYIDSDSFISFLETIKHYHQDIDIMIEAKAKDEALFRLVRQLKYKTNYQFLDDTTFIV